MTTMNSLGLSAALLAGLCLFSCDRAEPSPAVAQWREQVVFRAGGSASRASAAPNESLVSSLDLLVFRAADGKLDAAVRSEGTGGSIQTSVSAGVRLRYYLLANAPAGTAGAYRDERDFLSGLTLLDHGSPDGLVMRGSGELTVTSGGGIVPVEMERYVSKVSLRSVAVDYAAAAEVTVSRVVLVNAVGSTPWSGIPTAGELWYNRSGVDGSLPDTVRDMLVTEYGLRAQAGTSVTLQGSLYAMPNPTANGVNSSDEPAWSPRNTRVALELLVDGVPNWYPVDLPAMRCNAHYVIERLTVCGPGSDSPDKPVSREDVRFTVTVQPWDDADIGTSFD